MANMSISINGSPWNNGSALFDTGVPQSYIKVDNETYDYVPREHSRDGTILRPESRVRLIVGDSTDPVYEPAADKHYILEPKSTRQPFINTGQYFYESFDVLFDAQCGWLGLKSTSKEEFKGFQGTYSAQQTLELSLTANMGEHEL